MVYGVVLQRIVYSLVTDSLGNLYGPMYNTGIINRWLALTTPTSTSPQTTWYSSTPALVTAIGYFV